ncbi:hypothetical protein ACOME3_005929 [Neoechinorhynchus agilis]
MFGKFAVLNAREITLLISECRVCYDMVLIPCFVLGAEVFSAQYRGVPGVVANFVWSLGMMLLNLIAYFVRPWRRLYIAAYMPLLITISYYWFMNESLFWLAVNNDHDHINRILRQAYKVNSTKPEEQLFYLSEKSESDQELNSFALTTMISSARKSMKAITSSRPYAFSLFFGCLIMSLGTFLYWGFTLSAAMFSNNLYLQLFITAAVEIPKIVVCSVATKYFGRKTLLLSSHVVIAAIAITFGFLPDNKRNALNSINHIAKFMASVNVDFIWIYVPELFPTRYRQFGFGVAMVLSRTIAAFCPLLENSIRTQRLLTMNVIATLALVAAGGIIFLPETKIHTMLQLSDMKSMKTNADPFFKGIKNIINKFKWTDGNEEKN